MRRAQAEVFGLAFVVLIVVVALGLYLTLSFSGKGASALEEEIAFSNAYGKGLQTAMLQTTIPECGYSLQTALQNCHKDPISACARQGRSVPACEVAFDAWNAMLNVSLEQQGLRYHAQILSGGLPLTVSGQEFTLEPFPLRCNAGSNTLATPTQPIPLLSGQLEFIIAFC